MDLILNRFGYDEREGQKEVITALEDMSLMLISYQQEMGNRLLTNILASKKSAES